MKPFRGKPEKPESSKTEIQRVTASPGCDLPATGVESPRPLRRRGRSSSRTGTARVAAVCTSSLVGRRDPLGRRSKARPGDRVETASLALVVVIREPVRCPDRHARRYLSGVRAAFKASDPPQARRSSGGIGPRPDLGTVRLLAAVFSDRPLAPPVSDAIALGTFRTRLETRTKESSTCASHWDRRASRPRGATARRNSKPKGEVKAKASLRARRGRMGVAPPLLEGK